jgi:hypothetical protein
MGRWAGCLLLLEQHNLLPARHSKLRLLANATPATSLIECRPTASAPLPAAGAVLFGAMPHLICARRSRLTYGVQHAREHCSGDPPQSKFWHKEKGCFFTDDCFRQYVSINQLVGAGALPAAAQQR